MDMAENLAKANIQGVEIHLVKININRRKANLASRGRIQTGGVAALPTGPEKGCADKRTIINLDHLIDESTPEKNMHERMTPEEP